MSIVEAPQPATPAPAPATVEQTAVLPASGRRLPPWAERLASPLVVLLTAALVATTAAEGNTVAGLTRAEILMILGGGALLVAALLRPGAVRIPGGLPVAAFAALAALTALSIAWAIDPNAAWIEANRTVAYAFAFAGAAALAVVARDRAPAFLGGLLLGVAIVCALALLSKIVPEWLNENERFARLREPYGYWNAVGLTGALAAPLALWLGTRRWGAPAVSALAYPALTLALTAILLAYSRGSLLAALVGAAAWFVLVPARRLRGAAVVLLSIGAAAFVTAWTFGQNALTADRIELAARGAAGRELLVCLVAILLLVYVAGLVAAFLSDLRPLRLRQRRGLGIALLVCVALTPVGLAGVLSTTDEGLKGSITTAWQTISDPKAEAPSNEPGRLTETGSVRARYWVDGFRIGGDEAVGGVGAGGFAAARPRYRSDGIDVRHAHGYVPQTFADLGAVGLGLSLLLLVAWVLAARAAIRAASGPARTALVTLVAVALVFGTHSLIDWTWFIAGTALVGMLAAGFVAGAAPAGRRAVLLDRRAGMVAAALVAVLALAGAWSAWQPLRATDTADAALAAAERRDFDEGRELALEAAEINPLSAEPYQALASVERRAGDLEAAERALRDGVEVQPATYTTWLRLAEFQLWVQNDPRAALESVRAAVYLNPASFTVVQRYFDVARTLRNREAREGR